MTSLEKYPEFKELVSEISQLALKEIREHAGLIESEMPYKQQFVLEEIIKELEKSV